MNHLPVTNGPYGGNSVWAGHTEVVREVNPAVLQLKTVRHFHLWGTRHLPSSSVIDFKPRRLVSRWRIARQVWAKPSVRCVVWLVDYHSMASRGLCMNPLAQRLPGRILGSWYSTPRPMQACPLLWRSGPLLAINTLWVAISVVRSVAPAIETRKKHILFCGGERNNIRQHARTLRWFRGEVGHNPCHHFRHLGPMEFVDNISALLMVKNRQVQKWQ